MKNLFAILVVCLVVRYATGAAFEISRFSIDGGGVLRSTGGPLELSGTVGQPDAGVLTGGAFQLTGGFWFELGPGDCDEDGGVNLVDHVVFTECLRGPNGEVLSGCECYDADGSGAVDLRDFAITSQSFMNR